MTAWHRCEGTDLGHWRRERLFCEVGEVQEDLLRYSELLLDAGEGVQGLVKPAA